MLLHRMYCIAWKGQVCQLHTMCQVLKFTQPLKASACKQINYQYISGTCIKTSRLGILPRNLLSNSYLLQCRMLYSLTCILCMQYSAFVQFKSFYRNLLFTVCYLNLASCLCLYPSNLNMKYASSTVVFSSKENAQRADVQRKNIIW